jgi:hypothetical protein
MFRGCPKGLPFEQATPPARINWVDRILELTVPHEIDDADLVAMHSLFRDDGSALVIDWKSESSACAAPNAKQLYERAQAYERLARFGFAAHEESGFPYHLAFICRTIPLAVD